VHSGIVFQGRNKSLGVVFICGKVKKFGFGFFAIGIEGSLSTCSSEVSNSDESASSMGPGAIESSGSMTSEFDVSISVFATVSSGFPDSAKAIHEIVMLISKKDKANAKIFFINLSSPFKNSFRTQNAILKGTPPLGKIA